MKKILLVLFTLALVGTFFTGFTPASAKKDQIKLKVFEHYPVPGKPTPVSYCTVNSSDPSTYGIEKWHMPDAGLNYKINTSTIPTNLTKTDVQNVVSGSFTTWTTADSKQKFNYAGTTLAKGAKYDLTNAILFKPVSSSAIAVTYIWYDTQTSEVLDIDTIFNSRYKWSINAPTSGDCAGTVGTYDLQNIGTHEFGHWIGLDDIYTSADKDLTMYGYGDLQELKKDTLAAGDIAGVRAILP